MMHLFARARAGSFSTPANHLRRLVSMHPHYIAQIDAEAWAQHCLEQASTVIATHEYFEAIRLGDKQAVDVYENGVVLGFCRLQPGSIRALYPVTGSAWSEAQLLRMWRLGIAHSRQIRSDAFGTKRLAPLDST